MRTTPLHMRRRSFLRGVGAVCLLPYMEIMAKDAKQNKAMGQMAKRACFMFTPNGVSLPPKQNSAHSDWHWFPQKEGNSFGFNKVNESLKPYKDQVSYHGGLSHPKSRELLGHIAGDTWLTGGDVGGAEYKNTISLDQKISQHTGQFTRYPFLAMSCDGGIGYKSRVSTLSFNDSGKAIPTEASPREIFERYFSAGGQGSKNERRKQLQQGKKIVDAVMEDAKRLNRRLGKQDQAKLDEYLTSMTEVEGQIERTEAWLDVPLKAVNVDHLDLEVDAGAPQEYIRTMIDLMVIAFQTDITRVVTYMIAREDGMGLGDKFPQLALGIQSGHHRMSHSGSKKGGYEQWGRYDRFLMEQYTYLLKRLNEVEDENGPLMDTTLSLFGSCCSTTHNARNYPLVLGGGAKMGVKQGQYVVHDEKHVPLSNLFVSMQQAVGVEDENFGDSTGDLNKVLRG